MPRHQPALLAGPSPGGARLIHDPAEPETLTMRRSRPRQERSKQTRRGLIRTATRLWSERGFDDVTVEEICAAAGVGRTTFYLHFESKEQLLHSLAGATALGVASELDEVRQTGTLDEQLDVFISGVSRRMTAVPRSLVQLVIQSWPARYARTASDDAVGARSFADLLGELRSGLGIVSSRGCGMERGPSRGRPAGYYRPCPLTLFSS